MTPLDLYLKMYRIRAAEELLRQHYPEDEIRTPLHLSHGAEAIAVGVCAALGEDDQVLTSYRSHAVFLAKTGDLEAFFGELYGRVTGPAQGRAGSMHLADPSQGHMVASAVVGSYIPMALGLAWANKQKGNGRVVAVFFGDGAGDQGVLWESLNIACLWRLPVLFVCEDNGLSVQTPTCRRQGYSSITEVVRTFKCLVGEAGDLPGVGSVYELAKSVLESMKAAAQPGFLRLEYYRYLEHVGIGTDFDEGYRSPAPSDWDPLMFGRLHALMDSPIAESEVRAHEVAIDLLAKQALKWAQAAEEPDPAELTYGVFHEADT